MAHKVSSVSIKFLDLKSSNRMVMPFVYERVVKKACEKFRIDEEEFLEKYRIFYIDNFEVEQDIDNDAEF